MSPRAIRIAIAALAALGIAAFANSLSAPFLFDDLHAIVENPHVRALRPGGSLAQAMGAPEQSALSARPLASLSMAVSYALGGGLSPVAFHAGNVAIHIACALLLFEIVRRTLTDAAALIAAAIWLVHPLQTEVVDYATQRTESLMAFCYLLTLYASIQGWTRVAIAACAAGMMAKESMVTAPVAVLAYDVAVRGRSVRDALRERPSLYAGLAAGWIVLAVLGANGPHSQAAGYGTQVSVWTYALNQAPMLATYLRLSFWPAPLIVDYGPAAPIAWATALPGIVLVALVAVATILAWRRSPPLAFCGFWFFMTLSPASSIVPIATEVGAERRMYLPLAGLVVALIAVLSKAIDRVPARRLAAGTAVAAIAALTIVTRVRNAEYHDPVQLWTDSVAHRPHARARHALAFALQNAGRRTEAMAQYRLAAPGYSLAHYNLALLLLADGHRAEAEQELRQRLREAPRDLDARGVLADALLGERRFDAASVEYGALVRLNPGSAAAHNNLGLALVQQGRVDDAVREFRVAVGLAPADAGPQQNLARALGLLTRPARNGQPGLMR